MRKKNSERVYGTFLIYGKYSDIQKCFKNYGLDP